MARIAKELKPIEVNRLTTAGHHAVGGVAGLYLYVLDSGARSWVLRTMVGGKRRHMGLGAFPEVGLALAKERALSAKQSVEQGLDPIEERAKATAKLIAEQKSAISFEDATAEYIESKGSEFKNSKHLAQWTSTLKTYAFPSVGKSIVSDITQDDILKILNPIWKEKTETASRTRGRIEAVLDWATIRGYRKGENPARWKGHLDAILPAPGKIRKVVHHRAVAVSVLPKVFLDLKDRNGNSARALEFAILTAARSGEVRGATWEEIDFANKIWTVPADRMKAKVEHRVPLTDHVIRLLKNIGPRATGVIFSAPKGGELSDMALTKVLQRMEVDAVPHGFRSTFRDWAGEKTNYPRELAEQALAHTLKDKVEAAYRRGDLLEKRRPMMLDWANFCESHNKEIIAEIFRAVATRRKYST